MLKTLLKAAIAGWLAKRLAKRGGWKHKRKSWGHRSDSWDGYGRPSRYGHPPYRLRSGLKDMILGTILRRLGR